ncbi:unnamed product [Ostreococcus tauri]|uniref:Unnamed product n=1 Tax=Ostreococcus tauri TaxID=70448 RepID=A0A090M6E8_OSTTA|nr:unnamed product [Ostreococcus tauri]CEF97694.1 unnamed product [Ostreococcus tauri]|eukprot:XP_022838834.1 unnamed product [Ostreococcus tauri]
MTLLRVSRAFTVDVSPPGRVREYVALPAKEYALLDPSAVTRSDASERTFTVSAGRQKFAFLDVEPVGTIEVSATEDGCVQSLVDARMVNFGSERSGAVVEAVNASLRDLRLRNAVTATSGSDGEGDAIKCRIDVRGEFTEGVFARAGGSMNAIVGFSLRAVMPWFLTRLAEDYAKWARDEPRTSAMEKANLATVAAKILAGSRGKLPEGVSHDPVVASHVDVSSNALSVSYSNPFSTNHVSASYSSPTMSLPSVVSVNTRSCPFIVTFHVSSRIGLTRSGTGSLSASIPGVVNIFAENHPLNRARPSSPTSYAGVSNDRRVRNASSSSSRSVHREFPSPPPVSIASARADVTTDITAHAITAHDAKTRRRRPRSPRVVAIIAHPSSFLRVTPRPIAASRCRATASGADVPGRASAIDARARRCRARTTTTTTRARCL